MPCHAHCFLTFLQTQCSCHVNLFFFFYINLNLLDGSVFIRFPGGSEVKASASNVGDPGSIPGWGRSPGEGNVSPLQYSCLENPRDGEAWWATIYGVTKSQTWLSHFTSLHSSLHFHSISQVQLLRWLSLFSDLTLHYIAYSSIKYLESLSITASSQILFCFFLSIW